MIFFIDDEDANRRRWEILDPRIRAAHIVREKILHDGREVNAGLILAHRSTIIGQTVLNSFANIVSSSGKLTAVIIHGGFQTEGVLNPRVYCRRWPVENPIDQGFIKGWARFVAALDTGHVDFMLLEPLSTPNLSALRILLAANKVLVTAQRGQSGKEGKTQVVASVKRIFGCTSATELSKRFRQEVPEDTAQALAKSIEKGDLEELAEIIAEC